MPTPQTAAPWRIYLLIDSSTGPTNHPLGTIFYVGLRSDLPEPVYLREATEPESLPEAEVAARARLGHLNREGVRVIVEVVPEQWQEPARPPGLPLTTPELAAFLTGLEYAQAVTGIDLDPGVFLQCLSGGSQP